MYNEIINGYTLSFLIDKTSIFEVWHATNSYGKEAAVYILNKSFCDDPDIVETCRKDSKTLVKLSHPNLREMYGFAVFDGRPCLIAEYIIGTKLSQIIDENIPIEEDIIKQWWNQIVDVINYCHLNDFINFDIRPSNIIIEKNNNLKLLGFGFSDIYFRSDDFSPQNNIYSDSLIYLSPEQIKDENVTYKSNYYSVAMVFVTLLRVKFPFDISTASVFEIREYIFFHSLDLSMLSSQWRLILGPCLRSNPTSRGELRSFKDLQIDKDDIRRNFKFKKIHDGNSKDLKSDIFGKRLSIILSLSILLVSVAVVVTRLYFPDLFSNKQDAGIIAGELVEIQMVPVDGGSFPMGCQGVDLIECFEDERPIHKVTVSDFMMSKYEITQKQWYAILGTKPSFFQNCNDCPVDNVSKVDILVFLAKLNQLTGRNYRLPTEAEWEYAARGGKFSKGFVFAGSNDINEVAWYKGNSEGRTHPVGKKLPNELGLYDMCGNVREWCSDWWGPYSSDELVDPRGAAIGTHVVLRGGAWSNDKKFARLSVRSINLAQDKYSNNGFRVVESNY